MTPPPPHLLDVEVLGTELAVEMNKGAYRAIAIPCDEEDVMAAALQDYQAGTEAEPRAGL